MNEEVCVAAGDPGTTCQDWPQGLFSDSDSEQFAQNPGRYE